jgi:hypothetical protein
MARPFPPRPPRADKLSRRKKIRAIENEKDTHIAARDRAVQGIKDANEKLRNLRKSK